MAFILITGFSAGDKKYFVTYTTIPFGTKMVIRGLLLSILKNENI
jgi:hypothetical protein